LRKPGKKEEEFLPATVHAERLVRCVTVLKKRLGKKRKVPVQYKEKNNKNHGVTIKFSVNEPLQILRHSEERLKNFAGQKYVFDATELVKKKTNFTVTFP
jgi:hypothetical protein